VLMFAAALVFYRQGEANRLARSWVVHTYQTLQQIQSLSNKLKDAELGERGYLLTGKKEYLEPYNDAVNGSADIPLQLPEVKFVATKILDTSREPNNLPEEILEQREHLSLTQDLTVLKWLVADNSAQRHNMEELEAVVKDLTGYWADTVQERDKK